MAPKRVSNWKLAISSRLTPISLRHSSKRPIQSEKVPIFATLPGMNVNLSSQPKGRYLGSVDHIRQQWTRSDLKGYSATTFGPQPARALEQRNRTISNKSQNSILLEGCRNTTGLLAATNCPTA